jgi:hypothetical protein
LIPPLASIRAELGPTATSKHDVCQTPHVRCFSRSYDGSLVCNQHLLRRRVFAGAKKYGAALFKLATAALVLARGLIIVRLKPRHI